LIFLAIHTINPLSDRRWDDLIAQHPKASAFHQRAWLEALARTYAYEPVVFTTSPPGVALKNGLLFCHVNSWLTGRRLVSLPFSDHNEPICDNAQEIDTLISYSKAAMAHRRWQYLELRPRGDDVSRTAELLGFCPVNHYFLHVLDLRSELDEIFRSLHKDSLQRRIRRAERAGVVETYGASKELLNDFYALLVITRGRHRLPPPPRAWFENLISSHGKALEIRIAYEDERPIAAILTLRFRNIAYFKYGCSDAQFHKFGATPWLLWRAIVAAKSTGAVEFDLGRTEEENKGLLAFKNHWVSKHRRLTYWRYPGTQPDGLTSGWKLGMAKRVFAHMPHSLLRLSGKLAYRHIG
jgi:hypothetical protein